MATFFHFNSSPKATKGAFPKILVTDIKKFPIKKISDEKQKPFIGKVDQILEITKRSFYDQKNPSKEQLDLEKELTIKDSKLFEIVKSLNIHQWYTLVKEVRTEIVRYEGYISVPVF